MYKLRIMVIVASVMALAGCGTGGDFPTAPTSGRVVCQGQPVPHVMVFFEPLEAGKSALVGKQGFAIANADGTFTLSTYGEGDGAVVGKHSVRVGRPHAETYPRFTCPCYLNPDVELMVVEVKKGQENEFELVLKKKTAQDPPVRRED
jgi:hypothetical protein